MVAAKAAQAAAVVTSKVGGQKNHLLAALADALAGALGSVVAVAAFYPIDVAKTRAQASHSASRSDASAHGVGEQRKRGAWLRSRTLVALVSLLRKEGGVLRLYEGVEAKALQALMGSFVYFYTYAFIKGTMRRRTGGGNGALRPSLNLLAAALAGAVNQAFTLPLENITTRIQTSKHATPPHDDDDADASTSPDLPPRERPSASDESAINFRRCDDSGAMPEPAGIISLVSGGGLEGGTAREVPSTVTKDQSKESYGKSVERDAITGGAAEDDEGVASPVGGRDRGNLELPPRAFSRPSGLVGVLNPADVDGMEEDCLRGDLLDGMVPFGTSVSGDTRGKGSTRTCPRVVGRKGDRRGRLDSSGQEDTSPKTKYYEQRRHLQQQQQQQKPQPHEGRQFRQRRRRRQSLSAVALELYREGKGIARFWRGFAPSLILTCNPAINYTAFDLLKALWLRRRAASGINGSRMLAPGHAAVGSSGGGVPQARAGGGTGIGFLDPLESFLVAAVAKSIATLVTYPLIRAKVILMTCNSPSPSSRSETSATATTRATSTATRAEGDGTDDDRGEGGDGDGDGHGDSGTRGVPSMEGEADAGERLASRQDSIPSLVMGEGLVESGGGLAVAAAAEGRGGEKNAGDIREMASVMAEIVRNDGVGGLYTGCGAQLLHTILKSALLLATKEQIARAASSAVFLGERGVHPPSAPR